MEENDMHTCVSTLLWTAKGPLRGAEGPPFQNFFIYQDRSLKFGMHTAHIKWNTMIVTTGDKTNNRWQRGVPGDKLTSGNDGVQRVTTGDDRVQVQHTFFSTLFFRVYQLVHNISDLKRSFQIQGNLLWLNLLFKTDSLQFIYTFSSNRWILLSTQQLTYCSVCEIWHNKANIPMYSHFLFVNFRYYTSSIIIDKLIRTHPTFLVG